MTSINRGSPVPIYHQLKMLIRQRIGSGLWAPGDRIPTERELCRKHGISRSPVRQALNQLAQEGMLIRRPGLGTFVANHVSAETSPDVSIRMMCSDPHWSAVLEHTSCVWNEEHAEPKVTFETDVVPHDEFYEYLIAAVGSGAAPDLAMVDSVWVAGLAKSGFLYPLDDLRVPWNQSDFGEALPSVFVEANSLDHRLYGLPVKADASLLWYRRDWFAQEGLTPPQDWDDLIDVGVHFLQPVVQERYGFSHPLAFPGGTAGAEATVYSLLPFIWSAGGKIIDAEAGRVALSSPETSRAIRFLRELVHRHGISSPDVVAYGGDASPRLLAEGRVAMALGGSYDAELIQSVAGWSQADFSRRVGAVPPPPAPGQGHISTVGGTSYVVLRQCEQPALVTDVLKVATDPTAIGNLYRSMWLELPTPTFGAAPQPDTGALLTQISKMIALGRARPALPEYIKVSRQLQAMFEATLAGGQPIEDIVCRTAEFISVITEWPCGSVGRQG